MHRNKLVVGATFLAALTLAMFVLMLPLPASWQLPTSVFYVQLTAYAVLSCLHVGAAVLFTINLDVYKAKMQIAYIAIAIGIILAAIGTLQVPVIGALDAWQSQWVQNGGLVAPFFLSSFTIYIASQYLARLIKMKHLLTKVWMVLPLTLIICALTSLIPHITTGRSELSYDLALAGIAGAALLVFFAAFLVLGITRHTGAHYTGAMSWLTVTLFNSFLILGVQFIYTLTATDSTGLLAQLSTLLAIASGFLWLRAGYAFALTKDYGQEMPSSNSLFGSTQSIIARRPKTVIDMVTYAASLVSNAEEIDPLLDKLRTTTAKLRPGEKLSADETRLLVATYLKLEHYLTTKEAIRKFTEKEIRAQFDPLLQKMLASHAAKSNDRNLGAHYV